MIRRPPDLMLIMECVGVAITIVTFVYVQYLNYNKHNVKWNILNLIVLLNMMFTYGFMIPFLSLYGQTQARCEFLQGLATTCFFLSMFGSRFYFVMRSNQVAPPTKFQDRLGTCMAICVGIMMLHSLITFHTTNEVSITEPGHLCTIVPNSSWWAVLPLAMPIVFDLAVNFRFVMHILNATRIRRMSSVSEGHDNATKRLLRMTCFLCVACMICSIFTLLIVAHNFPIDPVWDHAIYGLDLCFTACAPAWPCIIIKVIKLVSQRSWDAVTPAPKKVASPPGTARLSTGSDAISTVANSSRDRSEH